MDMHSETVRVNFGRSIPLFPLSGVVLLPHTTARLHIFEPRYRQMTADVLDGSGLIAMAVLDQANDLPGVSRNPPIRPHVCVGMVAEHVRLPDGRYNLALSGVCRAEVVEEEAESDGRLYRQATLKPIGTSDLPEEDELGEMRSMLLRIVESDRIGDLGQVREHLETGGELPTLPLLEIVSLAMCSTLGDPDIAYAMLREPSVFERAGMIEREMSTLDRIYGLAVRQHDPEAPRGITWN